MARLWLTRAAWLAALGAVLAVAASFGLEAAWTLALLVFVLSLTIYSMYLRLVERIATERPVTIEGARVISGHETGA